MTGRTKKILHRSVYLCLLLFTLMNVVAYLHAYRFTHFDPAIATKTKDGSELSFWQKVNVVLFGVKNPRPVNGIQPDGAFETICLKGRRETECWYLKTQSARGTVALFHGYSGKKSGLLDKAEIFRSLGYNVLLVDFMGSGGSEGNQTTIGFYEAEQVKTAFDHLKRSGEQRIILFGTSMGAAAIMKAQNDYRLPCAGLIIECPFGSLLQAVQSRFSEMRLPAFPMANLLVFWGGTQNGFNGFDHNPADYAERINAPTLLMAGGKDEKVTWQETAAIFDHLKGPKKLVVYPLARHENYLRKYRREWTANVQAFLNDLDRKSSETVVMQP